MLHLDAVGECSFPNPLPSSSRRVFGNLLRRSECERKRSQGVPSLLELFRLEQLRLRRDEEHSLRNLRDQDLVHHSHEPVHHTCHE